MNYIIDYIWYTKHGKVWNSLKQSFDIVDYTY